MLSNFLLYHYESRSYKETPINLCCPILFTAPTSCTIRISDWSSRWPSDNAICPAHLHPSNGRSRTNWSGPCSPHVFVRSGRKLAGRRTPDCAAQRNQDAALTRPTRARVHEGRASRHSARQPRDFAWGLLALSSVAGRAEFAVPTRLLQRKLFAVKLVLVLGKLKLF